MTGMTDGIIAGYDGSAGSRRGTALGGPGSLGPRDGADHLPRLAAR